MCTVKYHYSCIELYASISLSTVDASRETCSQPSVRSNDMLKATRSHQQLNKNHTDVKTITSQASFHHTMDLYPWNACPSDHIQMCCSTR